MESGGPVKEALQQIASECQESGATKWQVLKLVKELTGFAGTEQQLRSRAGELLEKLNPEAAKVFMSFEKLKVYTSREKLEPFDRGNIIKSLLKETGVSRHIAEKIGGEVEDKVKDLNISYLNTQIIREMVNVRLLEYGHEVIHNEYARIGMPVFEVRKRLDTGNFENAEVLREYNWLAEIPAKARQLHFEGAIRIFAPEHFSTKLFAASRFFEGLSEDMAFEAEKLDAALTEPVTMRAFNFGIAGQDKKSRKKTAEDARASERVFRLTGKPRRVELCFFNDYEWRDLSSKKRQAVMIANELLACSPVFLKPYVSVDSRYQLKLLDKVVWRAGLEVVNSSRERIAKFWFGTIVCKKGSVLQTIGVNAQKIAESCSMKESAFLDRLRDVVKTCDELCKKKRSTLSKREHVPKGMLEESCVAAGFAGLAQACSALSQSEPEKVAAEAIELFQESGFSTFEIEAGTSAQVFGIRHARKEMQEMLMKIPIKARRSHGFGYYAESAKEAEMLLADVPCVVYAPK